MPIACSRRFATRRSESVEAGRNEPLSNKKQLIGSKMHTLWLNILRRENPSPIRGKAFYFPISMSVFAKKLVLVLSIAAIGLTGCTKKPIRPDPSQTAMGPGSAGYTDSSMLNPQDLNTYDPLLDDSAYGLESRGNGVIETDDMIRGLLEPVYFDFDKSGINANERIKLDAAIVYLDANPSHSLLLEGHCDWRGTSDYNLGLGDRRAGAAREYLEIAGVASSRIETSSKGDLESMENGGDSEMAQDRRAELVILKL